MKNVLFVFMILFLCSSCEKPIFNPNKPDNQFEEDKVYVRVVNELDIPMENVIVNGLEFGDLAAGQTSRYLSEDDLVVYHFENLSVQAMVNEENYYSNCIGVCGTPPIPTYTYESGVLTLKVMSENSKDWNCLEIEQIEEEAVETSAGWSE